MTDTEAIQKAQEEVDNLDVEKQKEDIDYMISELQKINSTMEDYTKNLEWEKVQEFVQSYDATYGANISDSLGKLAEWVGEIKYNLDPAKFQETMQSAVEDALNNQVGAIFDEDKRKAQGDVDDAMIKLEEKAKVLRDMNPGQNGWSKAATEYNDALGNTQKYIATAREYGAASGVKYDNVTALKNVDENLHRRYMVGLGDYSNDIFGFQGKKMGDYLVENPSRNVTDDILQSVITKSDDPILVYRYNNSSDEYNDPITLKQALGGDGEYNEFLKEVYGSGSANPTEVLTRYLSKNPENEHAIIFDRKNKDSFAKFTHGALVAMDYGRLGNEIMESGIFDFSTKSNTEIYGQRATDARSHNTAAAGSTNFVGGRVYVNELGLEGVITPHGTLTSLPAHTGIVPADLTKNLYDLGEVAPTLVKKYRNEIETVSNGGSSSDNSLNIGEIYTSVNADSNFDFNSLMTSIRQTIGNTRHLPQTQ